MISNERQIEIINILRKAPSVKVSELSERLNVTLPTIRRDLQELEDAKMLKRTHGGAINLINNTFEELLYEKENKNIYEKKLIASAALSLILDGDTVLLDSGTTTLELVRAIKKTTKHNVTIVTNDFNVAAELISDSKIDTIFIGGNIRYMTASTVGPIAENSLKNIYVDKVFIGVNGIDIERGFTTPNLYEAQIKHTMIQVGREIIVLADSSKFKKSSFGIVCPIGDVDYIITDEKADEEYMDEIGKQGVKVIIAMQDQPDY